MFRFFRRRRRPENAVNKLMTRWRSTWEKPGIIKPIRVVPYTMRRGILQNEISLENFKNGNNAYLMFRHNGRIPVAYSENTLKKLIQNGPQGNHIKNRNLNNFLSRVRNDAVLFRNVVTRQNRTRNNIRKVKLINGTKNKSARVIQKAVKNRFLNK